MGLFTRKKEDSWSNIVTGLGTARDKLMHSQSIFIPMLPDECEHIYASDKMARKIVDIPVETALRNKFRVEVEGMDENQIQDFNEELFYELERLNLLDNLEHGLKWGRTYGEGYLILGINDGEKNLENPLNLARIKDISYSQILTPRELSPIMPTLDPTSKNYLRPNFYRLVTFGGQITHTQIHYSRVIRMRGESLTRFLFIRNGYRDNSVLQPIREFLVAYSEMVHSLNTMIVENSITVYKMKDLAGLMQGGLSQFILNRLKIIDRAKGLFKSVPIDSDKEEIERKGGNYGGVGELVESIRKELAARVNIPQSILFNDQDSAGSISVGGKSEQERSNWQEKVENYQNNEIGPVLKEILKIVLSSKGCKLSAKVPDPDKMKIKFNSARTRSLEEEAEAMQAIADADERYIANGVVSRGEIRKSRFGEFGTYSKFNLQVEINEDELPEDPNKLPTQEGEESGGGDEDEDSSKD